MRLSWRLWRRRLTISSPRMAISSGWPLPICWFFLATMLGLCAALALWAFEFGREVAGLDPFDTKSLNRLREENERFRAEIARTSAVANTAESLLTAERATQAELIAQMRTLQAENQALKRDLGFFEQLLDTAADAQVGVRSVQATRKSPTVVTWRALLVQATKTPLTLKGGLEITYRGSLNGAPWSVTEPAALHPVALVQYLRIEGHSNLPAEAVVKSITVRLFEGGTVKSVLSTPLSG